MLGSKLRHRWIRLRCFMISSGQKRTQYLLKHHYFSQVGKNLVFFPRKIPQDPEFIRFHDNVVVATDVMFVNHDIIHDCFNQEENPRVKTGEIRKYYDCIEIMDNCFIGAKSLILPGVKLGPNLIVAAGSVVTKSFGEGLVIGGNPARVIGSYDDVKAKRAAFTEGYRECANYEQYTRLCWERFSKEK